ncbi:LysE family translocator [Motiliproteus sediminis]|uniref:LysE family translocator n=1 Tax=Motiliproteus sediminis TaxID=1468178 RepID=UPI001AEFCD67|nr:LysE family translocator [Motiliproteus sediminis]
MLPLDTLLGFTAAALLMGLVPGPDNLYVLAQSLQQGRHAGLWVTLGLCSGLVVHTLAVTLGVAALLATSATAFMLLKILGAGYLLYLARQAFRAGHSESPAVTPLSPRQLYRRGILMNISNPKVALFFLAFLPQFADPTRGEAQAQLLTLGLLFILTTLAVFGAIAWGAGMAGERLQGSATIQRLLQRLAGTLFLGLSLRLLASTREG